ncbi:MAG: HAMP domain-containing protein [Leptospira sp.]|nr:HAMP domain-containing protein [Leptospira sp.]
MKNQAYKQFISFGKSHHKLMFDSSLDSFHAEFDNQIVEKKRVWEENGISSVILVSSVNDEISGSDKNDLLLNNLKPVVNSVEIIPEAKISFSDFDSVVRCISDISAKIKDGGVVIIFRQQQRDLVYGFASGLLLYIKRDFLPEQAIQFLTGRDTYLETDSPIYLFEKAIHPEYQLPEFINEKKGSKNAGSETFQSPEDKTHSGVKSSESTDKKKESKKSIKNSEETEMESALTSKSDKPLDPAVLHAFKASRWTIQVKLMSIISLIIIFSLSSIIFLATLFFKNDNELRIAESNLALSEVIASQVRTDLTAITEKMVLMATTIKQEFRSSDQKKQFIDLFFRNDKNFISLGIYSEKGDSITANETLYNDEFLKENQLTEKDFDSLAELHGKKFAKSFTGAAVVHNSSPGFKIPVIGISLPFSTEEGKKSIILAYIKIDKVLSAFQKKGITDTMLINEEGNVVAHPDSKIVLSGSNLIDLPIVKKMLTDSQDNGNQRYEDKGVYYRGSFKKLGFAGAGVIATVSEDVAFAAVYQIQRRNLYIMMIVLSFAILIVFFYAKSLTNPVLTLLGATKQIESGDFGVQITPTTRDEIGVLTNSFIEMGKGLEEKEKVKSILGGMIDPTVVKEAMIDLAALKRGSEKEITAFFSDVAGFSTISEQLSSVDLAALLNEYLGSMTVILKTHDGVLDKYIGDAIVGIFNAPVEVKNHPLAAAKASLEMIAKLQELREYWVANNLYCKDAQEMDVRIGLNTGPAKVGFMGTEKLASYTMMGDTVNLAARLEAAGKDYGVNILISEMTNKMVSEEMFTRELDLVRVKGKNEPVRLYELIGIRSEVPLNIVESAELYEQALNHYLKREWDQAIEKLNRAEKIKGKKDKAIHMLIDRCEDYKSSPPDATWDGVFTRTHK